ncbi:MAG TPA: Ig-like domain-containing domain [Puia sp.]|nr:Ig-like domain-containing domain [Puia sp.]
MKAVKAIFYFLLIISITSIYTTTNSGCAMIMPPTGGPKDTLPPVLISAIPKDLSLNFKTNRIVFTFDEYVNVDKIQENLIISPTPKVSPIVSNNLKTVTVKLKDTLLPNTTYQLSFGNAIRDVNENNILKNFTYVFSSGPYLDSLQFSGKVIIAKTGKADSTLIVMLHRNLDDSAVIKDRPPYVTRVDTAGYFTFNYVAPGTYAVYALKDESNSRKYFSKSQLFAFADNPVEIKRETPAVTLYAYEEEPNIKKTNSASVAKPTAKEQKEKDKDKRLIFKTNLSDGKLDVLGNLELSFASALKTFDSSKIRFTDEQFRDLKNYHFITDKDSTHKTIELVYKWDLETKYNLIAEKDFAQDSAGRMLLKTDTIPFTTKKESDYGSLSLTFYNLDLKKNPVLQFMRGEEIKYSYPLTSRQFKRALFLPGQYKIIILYDDNKNGVWDPGEFFGKHRQPEKVERVNFNNKNNELNLKSSWDNEFDISL